MTCTGVVGGRWRATVTGWGAVEPWDGSPITDWFVAADDRWHRPAEETSTRQVCVDGTPVVETRVRIPGGDAVQRVYSVADAGGLTIIDVANESALPIAVAFTGGRLLSRRAAASTPVQGIDLPGDTAVYPIGHHASVTVGLAHSASASGLLPGTLPSANQVARGWLAQTQRASRLQLPDVAMVEAVTAARCELLLDGPQGDPVTVLLGIGELVRLGHRPEIWVPEIAAQLERWARTGTQIGGEFATGAVEAAARVLHAAGEHTALGDLRKMTLPTSGAGADAPDAPGVVPFRVEHLLVSSDEHSAELVPQGFPAGWLGLDFEAHGLAIGLGSTLSFAVRWHGERPAVLWEVSGEPMPLRRGEWSTGQLAGEALWPPERL